MNGLVRCRPVSAKIQPNSAPRSATGTVRGQLAPLGRQTDSRQVHAAGRAELKRTADARLPGLLPLTAFSQPASQPAQLVVMDVHPCFACTPSASPIDTAQELINKMHYTLYCTCTYCIVVPKEGISACHRGNSKRRAAGWGGSTAVRPPANDSNMGLSGTDAGVFFIGNRAASKKGRKKAGGCFDTMVVAVSRFPS